MKKLLFAAIALSLVSIAAVTIIHKSSNEQTSVVSPPPTPRQAVVRFEDTAQIYNETAVLNIKASTAEVVEAYKIYEQAVALKREKNGDVLSLKVFQKSMSLYPLSYAYYEYADALSRIKDDDTEVNKARAIARQVEQKIDGNIIVPAAKYALTHDRDTGVTMELLQYVLYKDTNAYKLVEKDKAFRTLENTGGYYYLMGRFLRNGDGQRSTMRTLSYTPISGMPYELTLDALFKKYEYKYDGHSGNYSSPYSLRDDAMRDIVRGNRFGNFSREVDHSIQYVATIHLSDKFSTYIYSTQEDVNGKNHLIDTNEKGEETGKSSRSHKREGREMQHAALDVSNNFYLVNINKAGHKIAEQQIGCSCSPIHISTATIDTTGLIEVKEMEQVWKKDPLVAGYNGNEVASRDVIGIKLYQVKEDGSIVEVSKGTVARTE